MARTREKDRGLTKLELHDLVVRHGHFTLSVDESFDSGRLGIYGASGAGKTTLLETIAGLLAPQKGRICLDEQPLDDTSQRMRVAPARRRIGFVPQDDTLFPHLNVERNVTYGLRGVFNEEIRQLTALLEIEHLLSRDVRQISGGERRRVAIARALAVKPNLLLLDEPLSGLDSRRRQSALELLVRLYESTRVPFVLVSHHIDELIFACEEIMELENGHVVWRGAADTLSR